MLGVEVFIRVIGDWFWTVVIRFGCISKAYYGGPHSDRVG